MNKIENFETGHQARFVNDNPWRQPTPSGFVETLWKFLFLRGERVPKRPLPREQADLRHLERENSAQLSATWLGHSTLLINLDGRRIMTDPVLQKRISVFGPTRYNGDVPVDVDRIPELDLVLISHNHYDHLNRWSIERLQERVRRFVVPLGVGKQLRKWGVPADKIIEMKWWRETTIDGLFIACTPTQHFSGRGLLDRDITLWASFVIQGPTHKIFFGGDSGYFEGFKRIGRKYGPFDMTFLECGAYDRRWHHIHMFPEETVRAHLDLQGKVLHPIHWGTFNLALHDWDEPMRRLTRAAAASGAEITVPVVGGTSIFPDRLHREHWWETGATATVPPPEALDVQAQEILK